MSEPPYSKDNHQRPKYLRELGISWSGVPMFNSNSYLVKANGDASKLAQLQQEDGVIDFPNVDDDDMDSLPEDRKIKDKEIKKKLKMEDKEEKVKDFINRSANSEFNHGWDKDKIVWH